MIKRRRFTVVAVALCMALMVNLFPGMVFADSADMSTSDVLADPVVLDCGVFSYTMDDVSRNDVTIVKTEDTADVIEYEVYDPKDPRVVDTIRIDFNTASAAYSTLNNDDGIRSTFFTRTKAIKNTKTNKTVVTLEFSTRVDLYESGSFRSFYGADTPNVTIKTALTDMELVNTEKSIKSTAGSFPTESLTYAYSTNLRTTGSVSTTASAQLPGAGFSVSTGTNTYYYRTVRATGTIDLY